MGTTNQELNAMHAALVNLRSELDAANQRADELAEQYAVAAPYYSMYHDERRGKEAAEAERDAAVARLAAVEKLCEKRINEQIDSMPPSIHDEVRTGEHVIVTVSAVLATARREDQK